MTFLSSLNIASDTQTHKRTLEMTSKTTYFITGTNKGIGLELVNQLSSNPNNEIVGSVRSLSNNYPELESLVRSRGNIKIVELDIGSQESIENLTKQLEGANIADKTIDIFIANAGISIFGGSVLTNTDRQTWIKQYEVNALGPLLTFQKVYPFMKNSHVKKVSFTSSLLGSIGGFYPLPDIAAYGQSKAALDYGVKSLSEELKSEEFKVIALHPGLVATDMVSSILEKDEADLLPSEKATKSLLITPEQSVNGILRVIADLNESNSGKLLTYEGSEYSW